jgi:glyoxylase-like metal-dependent hydrolase (beta-lactamase superfamily II)
MPSFAKLRSYKVEIIPGLFQISAQYANVFLIIDKSLTLIDTGFKSNVTYITKVIIDCGRSIDDLKMVMFSHNHADHTGGLAGLRRLASFQTAMHRADVFADTNDLLSGKSIPGKLLMFDSWKRRFILDKSRVNILLEGGESFDILGGMRVINTPGHTPGSISFYFPSHKLLIAGDAVTKKNGILGLPKKSISFNMNRAEESIRVMSKLDIDILCRGHGRPVLKNVTDSLRSLVSSF